MTLIDPDLRFRAMDLMIKSLMYRAGPYIFHAPGKKLNNALYIYTESISINNSNFFFNNEREIYIK